MTARLLRAIAVALCVWAANSLPAAQAQEPFYKGKTIRLVVGSTPGGFYDRWARLFARYMPKYIPGSPEMIVQNMPGAGSLVAANYVYNVAKPDGLTLGMVQYNIYMDQLVGRSEVQFDVRKFAWIGSPVSETVLLYMRKDAPYKSIHDIVKAKEPPKCGSSGTVSSDYILAKLLEETIGAKFNTVLGYPGGSEIDVAVEKGEVICRAHNISAHFGREPFNSWHQKDFDRHIVQTGRKRDARLSDTPTIYELFDQYRVVDISRRVAQVMLAGGELGRPMLATPGTPADRIRLLREAYMKSLKDPELLNEASKGKMDVDPSPGEELQDLITKVMDQPKEVQDRVKKMLGS
ncbi:MAG TPA: tripartite tricarboxylate transporter substrate-binding protein [Candidatus Eisenbacteria bacterium]|nr:tripartite tricarboxylate transporter substrate-binding protein [Candidatus Eisenbacteria bacterium]